MTENVVPPSTADTWNPSADLQEELQQQQDEAALQTQMQQESNMNLQQADQNLTTGVTPESDVAVQNPDLIGQDYGPVYGQGPDGQVTSGTVEMPGTNPATIEGISNEPPAPPEDPGITA